MTNITTSEIEKLREDLGALEKGIAMQLAAREYLAGEIGLNRQKRAAVLQKVYASIKERDNTIRVGSESSGMDFIEQNARAPMYAAMDLTGISGNQAARLEELYKQEHKLLVDMTLAGKRLEALRNARNVCQGRINGLPAEPAPAPAKPRRNLFG